MDISCTHCGLVMTEDEAIAGICPGCQRRIKTLGDGPVFESVNPEDVRSKLAIDDSMSSLARSMRTGPSQRSHGSSMRGLAWAAVALSLLPWAISIIAIRSTGFSGALEDVAPERCLHALLVAIAAVVIGLIASVNAVKDDQTTRQIASVAVVLAAFSIVIAGVVLTKAM